MRALWRKANPVELFLAAVASRIIKNFERVAPMLNVEILGVQVRLQGVRRDRPPKMVSVTYELIVDTTADDHKLELLHQNVRKYGTIYDTVAAAVELDGRIVRGSIPAP